MLDANDDLTLLDNNDAIINYVAWGSDPGTDDDAAVNAGQWTNGEYIDTTSLLEGESLGRNKDSTDTDLPADWENPSTNQADPYGVDTSIITIGAQNLSIPEYDLFIVPIMFIALIYFCFSKRFKIYTIQKKENYSKLRKPVNKVDKKSHSANKNIK
jgi:hypothetical protein